MSVEIMQRLSMISLILAALFFLIAVILFFLLDVPKLFGDITGSTEKKAVDQIRKQNEQSADKAYRTSYVNVTRGKITEKISPSAQLAKRTSGKDKSDNGHNLLTDDLNKGTQETTILGDHYDETMILNSDQNETVVLSSEQGDNKDFSVDVELGFTESHEVIE